MYSGNLIGTSLFRSSKFSKRYLLTRGLHCSGGEIGTYSTETLPGQLGWWRCSWLRSSNEDWKCRHQRCAAMPIDVNASLIDLMWQYALPGCRAKGVAGPVMSYKMFQINFGPSCVQHLISFFLCPARLSCIHSYNVLCFSAGVLCSRAIQCLRRHCFVSEKTCEDCVLRRTCSTCKWHV